MDEYPQLWQQYRKGDRSAYERLVDLHLPLVKITVGRMMMTIPSFITHDELYSAGCMGLLSAIKRYDPKSGAKFTTYAITRIRGAILDELRQRDVLGRVTRERVTRIHNAERELRNKGKELTAENIAGEAGLSLDEYWDAERGSMASHQISLSELADDGEHTLEDLLQTTKIQELGHKMEVEEVITVVQDLLSEKEKMLVVLYYNEGLTLKEIGEIMQVSESRICQMHTAMAKRVRKKLEKMGILF